MNHCAIQRSFFSMCNNHPVGHSSLDLLLRTYRTLDFRVMSSLWKLYNYFLGCSSNIRQQENTRVPCLFLSYRCSNLWFYHSTYIKIKRKVCEIVMTMFLNFTSGKKTHRNDKLHWKKYMVPYTHFGFGNRVSPVCP